MPKIMKDAALAVGVLAIAFTIALAVSPFIAIQITEAAEAKRSTVLCDGCRGTGPQPEKQVDGGMSVAQATCSETGGNTWPDAIDLEARDSSDHTFVSVENFLTMTTDARHGILLGFADSSFARIVITHAVGSHNCYFTLASLPS